MSKSSFDNQTRFNWGFWHGMVAATEKQKNFGFWTAGPLAGLTSLQEVLDKHYDPTYARGMVIGFEYATRVGPDDAKKVSTSELFWKQAVINGLVKAD
jgi:hypothetical protein